jgi:PKD repeat protein
LAAAVTLVTIMLILSGCSASSPKGESPGTTSAVAMPQPQSAGSSGIGSAPGSSGGYSYENYSGSSDSYYQYDKVTPAITVPPAQVTVNVPASNGTGEVNWEFVNSSQESQTIDRMVVRNGNLQLVVSDVATAVDNITKIASDSGGYVVSSQKWKDGERNVGSISVRVLAENYDKAVISLRGLAMSVISETTSSQDVTEEYVDLDSKVKNLEASETQLLKIMETASKTEDVLSIQRELTSVRGEIEQAKGRMQYLQRTSSTSLIEVRLDEAVIAVKFNAGKVSAGTDESITFTSEVSGGFAPYHYQWDFGDGTTSTDVSPGHSYKDAGSYPVTLKVTDDKGYTNSITRSDYINILGSWKPGSVAHSAWSGLAAFGRVLVNILIWLGIFSPLWIVIGLIVWFTVFRKKRKANV